MILNIRGTEIKLYFAEADWAWLEARRTYCALPAEIVIGQVFQRNKYAISIWPNINTSANPLAIGAHVYPDLSRPLKEKDTRSSEFAEFLRRLTRLIPQPTSLFRLGSGPKQ